MKRPGVNVTPPQLMFLAGSAIEGRKDDHLLSSSMTRSAPALHPSDSGRLVTPVTGVPRSGRRTTRSFEEVVRDETHPLHVEFEDVELMWWLTQFAESVAAEWLRAEPDQSGLYDRFLADCGQRLAEWPVEVSG